ncbi:MAG TPA: site-2 protease family protein [Thermoleophilaceae bacterium]|nr:site-2 protease family protein [Thermoleophilaceae bacterium]
MSWLLAFVGFALLVILHELGHFSVAKLVGMRVEKFSLFFPPTLFSKKVGETEYAIGAIPAGGYVKITGMNPDEELPPEVRDRAYHAQPVWKRIAVISAGPAVNLVLALVLLFVFYAAIGPPTGTDRVSSIEKGFPAEGELQPGDKLVAVDDLVGSPRALSDKIASHDCEGGSTRNRCVAADPATLVVRRDGQRRVIELSPIYDPGEERPRLGFRFAEGPREALPVGESADVSLDQFWFITKATVSLPARLFNAEQRKELSGVVGSYEVTRQTILNDFAEVIAILAVISLSLAIVNLFPFLPLDGGHIFWAIVEKVRGRPVSLAVMERAGVVGFMLVMVVFVIGFTNDLGRLTGEGFNVR